MAMLRHTSSICKYNNIFWNLKAQGTEKKKETMHG